MKKCFSWITFFFSVGLLVVASTYPRETSAGPFSPFGRKTSTRTVEKLAKEIDELHEKINDYGTIVAKHPDIWGESRLLRHRDEFEQQMAAELDKFTGTINARVNASDQAFLATATLIEAAINGGGAASKSDLRTYIGNVHKDVTVERTSAVSRPDFSKFAVGKSELKSTSLEPTLFLDQKARYLNHLHQLRRVNENDDTADAPGYTLDLVRVPVSVIPGERTRKGYGAEITLSANVVLGSRVLESTFRKWVINDLLHQLSIPLTSILNDPKIRQTAVVGQKDETKQLKFADLIKRLEDAEIPWHDSQWYTGIPRGKTAPASAPAASPAPAPAPAATPGNAAAEPEAVPPAEPLTDESRPDDSRSTGWIGFREALESTLGEVGEDLLTQLRNEIRESSVQVTIEGGVARTRNEQLPFPLSQFSTIYGQGLLLRTVWEAYERLGENKKIVHFQDIEGYLQVEIDAAYELFSRKPELWQHCTPYLYKAIRSRNHAMLTSLRSAFFEDVGTGPDQAGNTTTGAYAWAVLVEATLLNERLLRDMRETAANKGCCDPPAEWLPLFMADPPEYVSDAFNDYVQCRWPVYVFALDPINQEQNVGSSFSRRRELQLALAVGIATGQVRADNISRFARRLEMDMETIDLNRTVVSFSHGENVFGWRFYPRVQVPPTENNLKVGFRDLLIGGPTRDDDLKQWMLEAGTRECTALVVRPSFISSITVDTNSNWFKLTEPDDTLLDTRDAIDMSRKVKNMHELARRCVRDQDQFRGGIVHRLCRRVDQLAARLPLQTLAADVPIENVLGGFKMFVQGTTGLAPQLYTWYGEPGVDTTRETSLFLVGENFSIQSTRVIAGNLSLMADADRDKSRVELLSKRIMKITIPKGAKVSNDRNQDAMGKDREHLDIHIATPYGISQHLYVPVIKSEKSEAAKKAAEAKAAAEKALEEHVKADHIPDFSWKSEPKLNVVAKHDGLGFHDIKFTTASSKEVTIQRDDATPLPLKLVKAEIAFYMVFKSSDKEQKASSKIALGPYLMSQPVVDTTTKKVEWSLNLTDAAISEAIAARAKSKVEANFKLNEIELEAFIRFPTDNLPILRLSKKLNIKVEREKKPRAAAGEPADAPAPPEADGADSQPKTSPDEAG